jgi:acyl-CoA reductase-like NAD-dependent aldehyde dehydrogenase
LIKPSELSPNCSAAVKKFVHRYLDTDAIDVCEGAIDVAIAVNKLKVDLICFTGSTQVGKIVA